MMLTETFQLQDEVDYNDYEELTEVVLKAISRQQIKSVHLTPDEASKTLKILANMDCHDEINNMLQEKSNYDQLNNPFVNGPF